MSPARRSSPSMKTSVGQRGRRSKASPRRPKDLEELELVNGTLMINEYFKNLRRSAKRSMLEIAARRPFDEEHQPLGDVHLAKSVSCRLIQDRAAFEIPGQLEQLARRAKAGESVHLLGAAPIDLVIADEKRAIVIARGGLAVGAMPQAVIVNKGPVLDVLIETFEALWNRSVALRTVAQTNERGHALGDLDQRILTALGAGLTDNEIAVQLGVGHRTVQRRARQISDILGVETRFQAGVEAARRGWF